MDDAGIDVAIASISAPGVHLGDDAAARALACRCNDFLAEMVRSRPDRFGGFAILPLPNVDGALEELARALDQLGLDGVVLLTNALGHYLGDPLFRPLFDELQRRAALVFVHPTLSPDASAHGLGIPDSLLDFPVDTSRTVAHMHYSGTFARTPDVKYVPSHAGGTVPFLAKRFAIIDEMGVVPDEDGTRGTAADTFRRLYFDTALSWSDPTLHTLREVVGLDHVQYGSDYPVHGLSSGRMRMRPNSTDDDRRGHVRRRFKRRSHVPTPDIHPARPGESGLLPQETNCLIYHVCD
jgi:6-methylsalicylate decarboxylase